MEIEYGLKQVEDSRVYIFSIPFILLLLKNNSYCIINNIFNKED